MTFGQRISTLWGRCGLKIKPRAWLKTFVKISEWFKVVDHRLFQTHMVSMIINSVLIMMCNIHLGEKKKPQRKPLSLHPFIVKWYYSVLADHLKINQLVEWVGQISLFFILHSGITSHFHYLFSCHPLVQWLILWLQKCLLHTGHCSYYLNCPIISLNNLIQMVLLYLTVKWGN